MIFGDAVRPAESSEPGLWLVGARTGAWGTVGSLVPDGYDAVLRIHAPDPDVGDWWPDYRALLEDVAAIAAAHTSTPDAAWIAVWEGYGWDTAVTTIAWKDPLEPEEQQALDLEQARLRREDARRTEVVRRGLAQIPHLELRHRTYLLLRGAVRDAARLSEPGRPQEWQRPDLFWPDDRSWFVATDVDFWSLYVGGGEQLIAELARSVSTPTEVVTLDQPLAMED